jgi:hypothetical protein
MPVMDINDVIGESSVQSEGVWVEYPLEEGVSFKIAYLGTDSYQDYMQAKVFKLRRGRRDIPPEKLRPHVVAAIMKFILKGWKGWTDKGKEFEFNEENAKKLLEKSSVIRDFILREADNLENFKTESEEERPVEGDSKRISPRITPVASGMGERARVP